MNVSKFKICTAEDTHEQVKREAVVWEKIHHMKQGCSEPHKKFLQKFKETGKHKKIDKGYMNW